MTKASFSDDDIAITVYREDDGLDRCVVERVGSTMLVSSVFLAMGAPWFAVENGHLVLRATNGMWTFRLVQFLGDNRHLFAVRFALVDHDVASDSTRVVRADGMITVSTG